MQLRIEYTKPDVFDSKWLKYSTSLALNMIHVAPTTNLIPLVQLRIEYTKPDVFDSNDISCSIINRTQKTAICIFPISSLESKSKQDKVSCAYIRNPGFETVGKQILRVLALQCGLKEAD